MSDVHSERVAYHDLDQAPSVDFDVILEAFEMQLVLVALMPRITLFSCIFPLVLR